MCKVRARGGVTGKGGRWMSRSQALCCFVVAPLLEVLGAKKKESLTKEIKTVRSFQRASGLANELSEFVWLAEGLSSGRM